MRAVQIDTPMGKIFRCDLDRLQLRQNRPQSFKSMASAAEQIEVALCAARVVARNINDVPAPNRADINIEHVTQTLTHSIIHDAN